MYYYSYDPVSDISLPKSAEGVDVYDVTSYFPGEMEEASCGFAVK